MFALRGTRLSKAGTVQADIQLMKDRDAELYYAQRALKHCRKHIRRLQQQRPDVQWAFFTTGARPGVRILKLDDRKQLCGSTYMCAHTIVWFHPYFSDAVPVEAICSADRRVAWQLLRLRCCRNHCMPASSVLRQG